MRLKKDTRIILIVSIVAYLAGLCPAGSAKTARTKPKQKHPTALELLDKYAETQAKIRGSFISKHETSAEFEAYNKLRPQIKKGTSYEQHIKLELRSDGAKHYSLNKSWGDNPGWHTTTEEHANNVHVLWDGELRYQYMYSPDTPAKVHLENGRLFITPKNKLKVPTSRIRDFADGGTLRGFFYGSNERIDSDIRQAKTIALQPETEEINGSQCYVINATTKRCKYKIWIDPEHDYHIAKASVNRNWGAASRPEKRPTPPPDGTSKIVMGNVLFKKVNDNWIPIENDVTLAVEYVDGAYTKENYHHKVTEYVVNPDHDALGSFEPDFIRNGAKVKLIHIPKKKYTWQDGTLIDKDGNKLNMEKIRKEANNTEK